MKPERTIQYCFAGLLALCFFLLVILLIYKPIPEANKSTIDIVIGALAGSFVTIISYYFGSSKGSADKTDAINKQIENEKP